MKAIGILFASMAMLAPGTLVVTRPPAATQAASQDSAQDAAQTPAQDELEPGQSFPCTTNLKIVRVSDVRPGMMPKFLEAAKAQQAWYKDAGTTDEIEVQRVLERDPKTNAYTFSDTEALTTHIEPFGRPKGRVHDAHYNAFVKLYRESSTIKREYLTCVSK